MSLESLFQHILFSEHQAEESRRLQREVRADIGRCREGIRAAAHALQQEKSKLEAKVQQFSEKSLFLQLLKTQEKALERQCSEITSQRNMLLHTFETLKQKLTEEEEKFIKEITDFNNEYAITRKRELLMKENVKIEISDLESQANTLKMEMKSMEHDSGQLAELQKQKSELLQELFTLQKTLKAFEDKENEAICTTKRLEAEKVEISEKPQNDAECLRARRKETLLGLLEAIDKQQDDRDRDFVNANKITFILKKELELYKDEDMQSIYEALQTEIEFLELTLAQKELQENH